MGSNISGIFLVSLMYQDIKVGYISDILYPSQVFLRKAQVFRVHLNISQACLKHTPGVYQV